MIVRAPSVFSIRLSTAFLLLGCLSGCSSDIEGAFESKSADAAPIGNNPALSAALIETYLTDVRENQKTNPWADGSEDPNAFIQSSAPFELWTALAIVSDEAGKRYAVQQHITRLSVKAPSVESQLASQSTSQPTSQPEKQSATKSAWDFTDVLALSHRVETIDATIDATKDADNEPQVHSVQLAQRAALDLAGINPTLNKVWVGAFNLDFLQPTSATCNNTILLNAPQLTLNFVQTDCAKVTGSNQFSVSQGAGMPVSGDVAINGKTIAVSGVGWLAHAWGSPPNTDAAAVVFDQAWLWLDDSVEIQLQRSKRSSGRGPEITSGTARHLNTSLVKSTNAIAAEKATMSVDKTAPLVNAQLDTVANDTSTKVSPVPDAFELTESSLNIDVLIQAAFAGAQQPLFGAGWFGSVVVDGTHAGAGFINFSTSNAE